MKKIVLLIFSICAFKVVSTAQPLPNLIPYLDGVKWGYADSNGRVVIKPEWRWVGFFNNGRAYVYIYKGVCVIDTIGCYIIPPYRDLEGKYFTSWNGASYNAKGLSGKYGIIDSTNHEVLPCIYDKNDGDAYSAEMSGYFWRDERRHLLSAVVKKDGRFGIVDTLNNTLIPFEYDGFAKRFDKDLPAKYYMVLKNGKIRAH